MANSRAQPDCREIIKQEVSRLQFEGVHFDSNFTGSTFRECAFRECRLDRVLMHKTHWFKSDFDSSKLVVSFNDSVFEQCFFRNTRFQGLRGEYGGVRARFVECDFTGAVLKSTILRACKFENCVFAETQFIGCDLRGATHNGMPLKNFGEQ